jgi:uncharacterized protein
VWTVPIAFVAASFVAINYGGLSSRGAGLVVLLLLVALCVGVAEEGMFRGIGVITFRSSGYTEARVALWSSVVFGLVHLVNALGSGAGAIGQAVAVSFAGYFFYLTRRVSGGLLVPIVVHALFDFSLLSGSITPHALRRWCRRDPRLPHCGRRGPHSPASNRATTPSLTGHRNLAVVA